MSYLSLIKYFVFIMISIMAYLGKAIDTSQLQHDHNIKHTTMLRTLAFASPSIPPPPPISVPVYSLASPIVTNDAYTKTSMNIITFCSPVSVSTPKLWIVSLYHNTLTKDTFNKSKVAILQLLSKSQKDLIPILGKRSGYETDFNKKDACADVGYSWQSMSSINRTTIVDSSKDDVMLRDIELLPYCESYIKLKLLKTMDAGDHEVALCQVLGVGIWDHDSSMVVDLDPSIDIRPKDQETVLYTGFLRSEKII